MGSSSSACRARSAASEVAGSGNIIIKNTCSHNTINWVIAAGNALAPIVQASINTAVSGNTYAGSLGSTEPNATSRTDPASCRLIA